MYCGAFYEKAQMSFLSWHKNTYKVTDIYLICLLYRYHINHGVDGCKNVFYKYGNIMS